MGKLEGKSSGHHSSDVRHGARHRQLFVKEGAYVFITGRRKDKLDEAVKLIGKNVTGVQGDASNLAHLDRLYDTVKREKSSSSVAVRGPLRESGLCGKSRQIWSPGFLAGRNCRVPWTSWQLKHGDAATVHHALDEVVALHAVFVSGAVGEML